jgi:hypothetical protein
MTLHIILAILWFLSGIVSCVLLTLFEDDTDFTVGHIPLAIICGCLAPFTMLAAFIILPKRFINNNKILIKRRK